MRYKVHFTDHIGKGTINCDNEAECNEALKNLKEDPDCEDIWVEGCYPEEGWQA